MKRPPSSSRGYTLIEVMVVVAMIGILAAIALVGYRRWLLWARTSEVKDLVRAVATGQEQYHTDTDGYLDCSSSFTDYYPMAPSDRKHLFHDSSHPDALCWKLLQGDADAATYASFITMAGSPGDAIPALPTDQDIDVVPPAGRGWFFVLAVTDQDADGDLGFAYTSSLQPGEVHEEELEE